MNRKEILIFAGVLLVLILQAFLVKGDGSFFNAPSSGYGVNYQPQPDFQTYYTQGNVNDYWPVLNEKEGGCIGRQDFVLQVAPGGCQPMVVRSDLLADQNVPVFCQIDAMQLNPLLNVKEIKNIRFTGQYPKEVISAGFHPARAALRTTDALLGSPLINNIGYAVVILKRNPNEKTLPDKITVNLTGLLEYESGNALGIGRTEFLLQAVDENNWEGEKVNYAFWNGRYYLRLDGADANFANIAVYDGDRKLTSVKVEKDKSSNIIYLPGFYCQAGLEANYKGFVSGPARARIEVTGDLGTDSFMVSDGSYFDNDRCYVQRIASNKSYEGTGKVTISCKGNSAEILSLDVKSGELKDRDISNTSAEQEFKNAIVAYEKVADEYPAERSSDAKGAVLYGEDALVKSLGIARDGNISSIKQETQKRLLEKLIDKYPNSISIQKYKNELAQMQKVDTSGSIKTLKIDGKFRTIRLVSIQKGEPSTADFNINGAAVTLKIDESFSNKITKILFKRVLDSNSVEVSVSCKKGNSYENKGTKVLSKNSAGEELCPGENVKLEEVHSTNVAKIILTPKVSGTRTETNISLTIGIEKRGIKLSPERRKEMIKNINESIKQWESISNKLSKVVSGLKATCLATSAALVVKNLISGFGGESLAREQAMSGDQGWINKCNQMVKDKTYGYSTLTQCLNAKSDIISKEIDTRKKVIEESNKAINEIEKPATTEGSFLAGDVVDSQKASAALLAKMKIEFSSDSRVQALKEPDKEGRTAYSYSELRDLYYNLKLEKNGLDVKKISDGIFESISSEQKVLDSLKASESGGGLSGVAQSNKLGNFASASGRFYDIDTNGLIIGTNKVTGLNNTDYGKVAVRFRGMDSSSSNIEDYLIVGTRDPSNAGRIVPTRVYSYVEDLNGIIVTETNLNVDTFLTNNNVGFLKDFNEGTNYNTKINERYQKVRFFETEPFKGLPAYVPFNVNNGWYAKVEPKLGLLNTPKSYDASALPKTWKICNVGIDGIEGLNDDCQIVYQGRYDSILGQNDAMSRKLMEDSSRALLDAASQSNLAKIKINGKSLEKDSIPEAVMDATQCQNFMSISDCNILFNVCDPVICPSSRCDFGGSYRVANVIQSGIVGSALLCLPNMKDPVFIPVCLSGIEAGIDSYVSILKNHRDCLQNSLDTGQMTGICDEIYSIYKCEFFWRQAAPVANLVIPKLVGMAYGEKGARGGGEYLSTKSAFDNAKKSADYFVQSYAVNSFKAFNIKSIEQVGSELCKGSLSAVLPKGLKSLDKPDSPPQFEAWFDSTRFNDATIPATAQYKVFYQIYAGKTNGVYYQVYLKNPPENSYYYSSPTIQVVSGFVAAGEYASQTKDFTAPEGYGELCVRINNEEKCGFKQVSTSFAVNYLSDKYAEEQLTEKGITSEGACTSGTPSLMGLVANINPQSALEESALPQDYKRGIVRICASKNPGASTDPGRYSDVGYCGDQKLRCWLDKTSVDRAISESDIGVKNETLSKIQLAQNEYLNGQGYLLGGDAKKELDNLQKSLVDESSSLTDRDKVNKFLAKNNVAGIAERLIRNDHKARLLLIEASAVAKPIENWLISQNILEIKKPVPQQPDVKSEESGLDVGADVGETPALAIPGDGRRRDATSSGGENAQGSSSVGLTLSANYDGKSNINILKDGKETGYYISGSKVKKKEYFVFDFSAADIVVGVVKDDSNVITLLELKKVSVEKDFGAGFDGAKIEGNKIILAFSISAEDLKKIENNFKDGDKIRVGLNEYTYSVGQIYSVWFRPARADENQAVSYSTFDFLKMIKEKKYAQFDFYKIDLTTPIRFDNLDGVNAVDKFIVYLREFRG